MFKKGTHLADRQISEWSWRSLCGRFIRDKEHIVTKDPSCQICASIKIKWRLPDGK